MAETVVTDMQDRLAGYLRAWAALPHEWGLSDCVLFLAGWVQARHGVDPAAWARGRYATAEEAEALAGKGGMVGAVNRSLRAAGIRRTRDPQAGDIAIIDVPGGPIGAIRTGAGWVLHADQGLVRLPAARIIAAWRV